MDAALLNDLGVEDLLEIEVVRTMILMKHVFSEAFRPFGVETFEWHALLRLAEADGPTQTDLGRKLLRDKVAITRLVDALEGKGLARRKADTGDARKQRVFLTPKGRRLVPRLLEAHNRVSQRACAGLSERDQATLRRILGKLQAGLAGL